MATAFSTTTVAAAALALVAFGSPARAFIATDTNFFTTSVNGTLKFTYEGHSAADTDTMYFVFNGQVIFVNTADPLATPPVSIPVVASGSPYQLKLVDTPVPATWYSDPVQNNDSMSVHLQGSNTGINNGFGAFGIGDPPNPIPTTNCVAPDGGTTNTCYFGWEDRQFPGADSDYNDLVFALEFIPGTTTVPEPASLSLLGTALVGFGWFTRHRRRAKSSKAI